MKQYSIALLSLFTLAFGVASTQAQKDFDEAYRFIFYAVQEGCYEDGLSNGDVAQILLRDDKTKYHYAHFIYACPVCTPTIHALEAYQSRPEHFYAMKSPATTFGPGLGADLGKKLYSQKPEDRLEAINSLMQRWISRRTTMLRLSDKERAELQSTLEKMRKKEKGYLQNWETDRGSTYPISAFTNVHQCAVCNGACGMALQPAAKK